MLEEKEENKGRGSLCCGLSNSNLQCKELLRGGGKWRFGLLNIYCSFITLFLICHSLNFPNNNLISEVNGRRLHCGTVE